MATAVAIVLLPLALLWALPLLAELLSLGRRRRAAATGDAGRQRLLFLIPAHNEGLLIKDCARSLLDMTHARADSDVVIVADNCSDDTAEIARVEGARVLERFNTEERGKPYAIEWAMAQHDLTRYDAVVIVDADTIVVPGFADAFAAEAPLRDKAVQGYFGISNEKDSWLSLLGGLLSRVRYEGQYLQKKKAGLNCPLTGNGMCLGTNLLARAGWPNNDLTENWELYGRYAARGETVDFAPAAHLFSQEAHTLEQSATQRKRWQAGRITVLKRHWRAIVGSARIDLAQKVDALAELTSPGPVLHTAVAAVGAAALLALGGPAATAVGVLFALSLVPMVFWTLVVWARQPNRGAILAAFLRLPVYLVWRVVVAVLAVSTGKRGIWQRSPRHRSPEAAA